MVSLRGWSILLCALLNVCPVAAFLHLRVPHPFHRNRKIVNPHRLATAAAIRSQLGDSRNILFSETLDTAPLEEYLNVLTSNQPGEPLTFERLQYEPRNIECASLVSTLDQRFTPSDFSTPPPLPVLFGSKGIGKSSLLQRFPESAEYKEHLALRYGGKQPIVAPISFTCEMGGGGAAFGLRALFGAARAMGLLSEGMSAQWESFVNQFGELASLSVVDAVLLLTRAIASR